MNKILCLLFFFCCSLYGATELSFVGKVLTTEQHTYELHDYLSRGAFGAVYRATNENGERVAIKIFLNSWGGSNSFFTSWPLPSQNQDPIIPSNAPKDPFSTTNIFSIEREWEIGTQFDHPNIIKAYDRGEIPPENEGENPHSFLVLEFVTGTTLYEIADGHHSRDSMIVAIIQLLDALNYGLSQNMYHCDLQATNIMISDEGTLKMIDLGSYLSCESISKQPPEQGFWHLKFAYLLMKTILKKGGYQKNEIDIFTSQLKDEVKKVRNSELPSIELFQHVFEAWSNILIQLQEGTDIREKQDKQDRCAEG